jgi:hypothetical protein
MVGTEGVDGDQDNGAGVAFWFWAAGDEGS